LRVKISKTWIGRVTISPIRSRRRLHFCDQHGVSRLASNPSRDEAQVTQLAFSASRKGSTHSGLVHGVGPVLAQFGRGKQSSRAIVAPRGRETEDRCRRHRLHGMDEGSGQLSGFGAAAIRSET
jgi:hypothetical protein